MPGYKCPVAHTDILIIDTKCSVGHKKHARIQCPAANTIQAQPRDTYQAYQDISVLWHIFLVRNKSLKSPMFCTFPSAFGLKRGSSGYSFLLVVAIFRRISSVSSTFPFSNKYLADSGIYLEKESI